MQSVVRCFLECFHEIVCIKDSKYLLYSSVIPTLTTPLENIGWCCTWKTLHMANSLTLLVDPQTPRLELLLNYNCSNWIFNDRHLQSAISRFCGHYCIFYCLHRCRGSSVNAVVGKLTLDNGLNDYLIHKYICH